MSALGAILMKRWNDGTPVLAVTAWQLVIGGLELLLVAAVFEGPPPAATPTEFVAFAYISLIATALGFFCWFSGFRHLPAGVVGVIGLLNPVTGVALGVLVSGETLSTLQLMGIGLVLGSIMLVNAQRYSSRTESIRPHSG